MVSKITFPYILITSYHGLSLESSKDNSLVLQQCYDDKTITKVPQRWLSADCS